MYVLFMSFAGVFYGRVPFGTDQYTPDFQTSDTIAIKRSALCSCAAVQLCSCAAVQLCSILEWSCFQKWEAFHTFVNVNVFFTISRSRTMRGDGQGQLLSILTGNYKFIHARGIQHP